MRLCKGRLSARAILPESIDINKYRKTYSYSSVCRNDVFCPFEACSSCVVKELFIFSEYFQIFFRVKKYATASFCSLNQKDTKQLSSTFRILKSFEKTLGKSFEEVKQVRQRRTGRLLRRLYSTEFWSLPPFILFYYSTIHLRKTFVKRLC